MLPPVSVRTADCGASSTNGSAWGMASDGPAAPVAALRIATDVGVRRQGDYRLTLGDRRLRLGVAVDHVDMLADREINGAVWRLRELILSECPGTGQLNLGCNAQARRRRRRTRADGRERRHRSTGPRNYQPGNAGNGRGFHASSEQSSHGQRLLPPRNQQWRRAPDSTGSPDPTQMLLAALPVGPDRILPGRAFEQWRWLPAPHSRRAGCPGHPCRGAARAPDRQGSALRPAGKRPGRPRPVHPP